MRLILLLLLCQVPSVFAVDLGKQGVVFKIKEEGFTVMMKRKLAQVDMNKEQKKMQAIAKDRVENPTAVRGIKPALQSRVFYFDPTYTAPEDVALPCGKILHRSGTRVNPLEHMSLNRRILFIDAREIAQTSWLKEMLNNPLKEQVEPVEDRVILVGGSVFKLQEHLGAEHADKVYFDQHGELTKRFGIKASPAIAEQESLRIKIEEIKLEEL